MQRSTTSVRACLRGGGAPQVGEVTCGRSPHLSCKRDQIKMRDYMDGGLPHIPGAPQRADFLRPIFRPTKLAFLRARAILKYWRQINQQPFAALQARLHSLLFLK